MKHSMIALVLACMLSAQPSPSSGASSGAPPNGAPDAPPATADARLAEALAALDALEMERATALLEPLVATPGLPDDVRARAWLALGLTRASLLDTDGARAAFTAALAIDAQLELPDGTSPKVQALFDRTRDALAVDVRPRVPDPVQVVTPEEQPDARAVPVRPENRVERTDDFGRLPWLVLGGGLLAGGTIAAAVAFVAEDSLGRPFPGRTRAEYDDTRGLGVGALGASVLMLATGAVVIAATLALVEETR